MKFKTSVMILLLVILKVMHAAAPADPCPSNINDIVANMCTDNVAVEHKKDGSKAVDSVLLRITKQQNNCICHVSLHNNATKYTIYMSKYEGQSNAAPEQQNCGLAVDVKYLDTSDTPQSLQSINCTRGTSMRSIALGGRNLIFKSRIISGDFTRGYCMQIYRMANILWSNMRGAGEECLEAYLKSDGCKKKQQYESINDCKMSDILNKSGTDDDWIVTYGTQHTSFDECKQYCLQTKICVAVHYENRNKYCFVYNQTTSLFERDDATYSQKQCLETPKLKIRCFPPESTTQTDQETTTEETFTTKLVTVTKPISDNLVTNSNTQSTVEEKQKNIKDTSPSFLVALIIAIIGCTVAVIFAGTTVYYKRQLLTQESKSKKSLESSVNYVDLSVARDVSNYSAINTHVGNEQYETVK